MELKTELGKLSEPLGPCPQCKEQREQDRGDVADGLCWRCRSLEGKMADVFLAAAEGDTTRIPEYEELIAKLRARYDDPVHPRMTDRELLEKLRSDLRAHPVDPANTPTIVDDLDAREFIHHESIEEVLALVKSFDQPMSRFLSPAEWEKKFTLGWRTIKRRIDAGEIVARQQNRKSWSIALANVPENHRDSVR